MDFQYTFRQAHQDRLENVGVVRYWPSDGFGVLKARRDPRRTVQWLHPVIAAIVSILTK